MDGWIDGYMGGWTGGWMDGWYKGEKDRKGRRWEIGRMSE
jgi:hypothetical protein